MVNGNEGIAPVLADAHACKLLEAPPARGGQREPSTFRRHLTNRVTGIGNREARISHRL
jgi:hypothetical protein